MNRHGLIGLPAVSLVALVMASSGAVSQQTSLRQQLVGAWTLVSIISTDKQGVKSERRGPNPKGLLIFDASGRYSILTARSDIANFKINNVDQGTPEENKAVLTGMIANIGTWSVDEASKTLIQHWDGALFPNNEGRETKSSIILTGDELKLVGTSPAGSTDTDVYRRAK